MLYYKYLNPINTTFDFVKNWCKKGIGNLFSLWTAIELPRKQDHLESQSLPPQIFGRTFRDLDI